MWYIILFVIGLLLGFITTLLFSKKIKRIENDIKEDITNIHNHISNIDNKIETVITKASKDVDKFNGGGSPKTDRKQ